MIWIVLGALCYRIKGGLLDDLLGKEIPNGYLRATWALCVTLYVCRNGDYLLVSPLIFAAAFLGVTWGYFGQFGLDMPYNRNWKNYALLTLDGMCVMLPVAALMSTLGYHQLWFGVLAGASFVPCYLAGNIIYKFCKWQRSTQWGELLLGGVIMGVL